MCDELSDHLPTATVGFPTTPVTPSPTNPPAVTEAGISIDSNSCNYCIGPNERASFYVAKNPTWIPTESPITSRPTSSSLPITTVFSPRYNEKHANGWYKASSLRPSDPIPNRANRHPRSYYLMAHTISNRHITSDNNCRAFSLPNNNQGPISIPGA